MKRALVVNPYWESLGGGERYTASFIKLLLDRDWRVDIKWHRNISEDVKNRFDIDISKSTYNLQPKTYHYNLVFWVSDGSLPTSMVAKTLIHFQFPFQNVRGSHPFNLLKSRFYTFVCNSGFTKSFIDREFKVNSQVVYPPVTTSDFTTGKKTDTILYVGRFSHLTQAKNPHLLIESFKKIQARLPGWRLILAGGDGVGTPAGEIARLRRLASRAPIEIITNPPLDRLRQLYARAAIFWSASGVGADETTQALKVEHFGISVVEAMAAGAVPVISNLGGHKEIVTPGVTGYLFNTLDQLENLTIKLAANRRQLASLSAAAHAASRRFDVSEFNRRIMALI